ncbi:MAG: DUF2173 family protein [Gammaproteobacteria bacterium]
MSKIRDLLNLDCVYAAGEIDTDGALRHFETSDGFVLPEVTAQAIAKAAHNANGAMRDLADDLQAATDVPWQPDHGWVFAGAAFSLAVCNGMGVFVDTHNSDFSAILRALAAL